ncbi:MAG TPA: hypothetical protein V6C97_01745 [Oculatellaceae cyanobacterium]
MSKIFESPVAKNTAVLLVLLIVAGLICRKILTEGLIYGSDDIWTHLFWLRDFTRELEEGIIYPRWLAQNDFLFGGPVLVFYPPLCFYLGAALKILCQLKVEQALSVMLLLGAFSTSACFYLAGLHRWGRKAAALGALLLGLSPYIVIDAYVRGAIPELWSLGWLSLILLSVDRVREKIWRYTLALGFFLIALTHVPTTLIYTCAWLSRLSFCSIRTLDGGSILRWNIIYAALGLGCASFFLLPAWLEERFVNITAVIADRYCGNLLSFNRFDGVPFVPPVAIAATIFALFFFLIIAFCRFRKPRFSQELKEPTYWVCLNLIAFFLMTDLFRPLWDMTKILQFLQFPWRLMTLTIFSCAVLFAYCIRAISERKFVTPVRSLLYLLLAVPFLHGIYFDYTIQKFRAGLNEPQPYKLNDTPTKDASSAVFWVKGYEGLRKQMLARMEKTTGYYGVPEYRPLAGVIGGTPHTSAEPEENRSEFLTVEGGGNIVPGKSTSYSKEFILKPQGKLRMVVRLYYYPGWHLYCDGREHQILQTDEGTIMFDVPQGEHKFVLKYEDTLALKLGIAVSCLSLALLVLLARQERTPPK